MLTKKCLRKKIESVSAVQDVIELAPVVNLETANQLFFSNDLHQDLALTHCQPQVSDPLNEAISQDQELAESTVTSAYDEVCSTSLETLVHSCFLVIGISTQNIGWYSMLLSHQQEQPVDFKLF